MISIEFFDTAALHIKLEQIQHQQQVGQQAVEKQFQELKDLTLGGMPSKPSNKNSMVSIDAAVDGDVDVDVNVVQSP